MSKVIEINKVYAVNKISDQFDKLKLRLERDRIYSTSGILQQGTTYRYAKNCEAQGFTITLMVLTNKKLNPATASKKLDGIAQNITLNQLQQMSTKPLNLEIDWTQ